MNNLWGLYKRVIQKNCAITHNQKELPYWRDRIFVGSVTYVLPLSLLALIPGIPLAYLNEFWGMLAGDFVTVSILFLVALHPSISLVWRKRLFVFSVYLIALVLLFYMSNFGPSLIYLLAASVFSALIFPSDKRFIAAHINSAIVVIYTLLLYFQLGHYYQIAEENPAIGWFGVATNMLFLSYFFAYIIPMLFEGLQSNINDKSQLQKALEQEKEKLNESLMLIESKNKELEQFAYAASHDLQEPLRTMSGFLEIMEIKHSQQLDEQGRSYVKHIKESASRMSHLIQDLLKYSQLDDPQALRAKVDLNLLMEDVKQNYKQQIDEGILSLNYGNLPDIMGHKTALNQLVTNLISNAVKFRKSSNTLHKVEVKAKEDEQYWRVSVTDNGIGIAEEHKEKIFELFKRLHTKNEYPGTGIGLALCKKIVDQHHGEIWVDSKVGEGSTFIFTIKK